MFQETHLPHEGRWVGVAWIAQKTELSRETIRKLLAQAGLRPAKWWRAYHGRYVRYPLYNRDEVEALLSSDLLRKAKARQLLYWYRRWTARASRLEKFERKYGSWQNAVQDAAYAMFQLNRYAKYDRCRKSHRREIYELKSEFIRFAIEHGFCLGYREQSVQYLYRYRDGTGAAGVGDVNDWYHDDTDEEWSYLEVADAELDEKGVPDNGNDYSECDGTGVYEVPFVLFRFKFGEQNYAWHMRYYDVPHSWLDGLPVLVDEPNTFLSAGPRAISLRPRQFAEAKALIRWVLSEANGQEKAHVAKQT